MSLHESSTQGPSRPSRRACGPATPGWVPPNKGRKFAPEVLTRLEVQALMAACSRRAPTGRRNRAMIATLYRTGLRLGELLSLRPKDLDPNAQTLRVMHGKGGKPRTVGVDAGTLALLEDWLEVRATLKIRKKDPLFSTLKGGEIKQAYVRAMLRRMAARGGIERRVNPHAFRHTYAVELARERVPLAHISRLLGHSSVGTTSVYLAALSPSEALAFVHARPSWNDGEE